MNSRLRPVEWVALGGLITWTASALILWRAMRRARWLEDAPPAAEDACPSLSIVLPACNEEAMVEATSRSILALDYPDLEIVAVDDRSSDSTGAILDQLALEDARLRVVHLSHLPAGWLGQNHANWCGAQISRGEFILFTNVDVLFGAEALRRVMSIVNQTAADHLVVMPEIILLGFWERSLIGYFGRVLFHLMRQSWQVENPKSGAHVGVGGFNMVRRSAYEKAGSYKALRMDVVEDIKLGKVMKRSGARQVLVLGGPLVRMRWFDGLGGFIHGLTKNTFAGVDYRWDRAIAATVLLGMLHVFPAVGIFWGTRRSRAASLGALIAMVAAAAVPCGDSPSGRRARTAEALSAPRWDGETTPGPLYGLSYPLAAAVCIFVLWRSALLCQLRGGVVWRDTLYPIEELRKSLV